MLNLSDNELDRLSREAASQHDPGDLMGPQAWERLEVRLDKELGRAGPDISRGLRGFRRLPFQYAPVILLIVGVSYYFVKQAKGRKAENSGSPPLTVVKTPQQQPGSMASDSSTQNPDYRDNSTSTPYHQDQSQNIDSNLASAGSAPADLSGAPSGAPAGASKAPNASGSAPNSTGSATNTPASTSSASGGTSIVSGRTIKSPGGASNSPGGTSSPSARTSITSGRTSNTSGVTAIASGKTSHTRERTSNALRGTSNAPGTSRGAGNHLATTTGSHNRHPRDRSGDLSKTTSDATTSTNTSGPAEPSGLSRSFIQRPQFTRSHPAISDSALRAYTAATPTNPGKSDGPSLRISRPFTFGIQLAPDFASVNALAGDKPGSSIGLTVDYQILDRWHIGTGLLFSRKNYTAKNTDFKVPHDYYQSVGLKRVDFIKGTMNMLEIPINLRYDFSVTGNTVFFASGGVSTYLFGNERSKYYYNFAGTEMCREFQYTNKQGILSSASLSMGVETGISNDFSIMVAPYMKLPLSDLGFGRIRMSSVGINVALRYSPVLSRKRKH